MSKDVYYKGEWSADCDRCGFTYKSSELRLEWDGLMVCDRCWEPRQPQDFVRARVDIQAPPWTRPEGTDQFVAQCNTNSGYCGIGTCGCAIVGCTQIPSAIVSPPPASTFNEP